MNLYNFHFFFFLVAIVFTFYPTVTSKASSAWCLKYFVSISNMHKNVYIKYAQKWFCVYIQYAKDINVGTLLFHCAFFCFYSNDEQHSYWGTSNHPAKSCCSLIFLIMIGFLLCAGHLKSGQLIREKLSAKEKDLLIVLFLFCQVLVLYWSGLSGILGP